MSFDCGKCECSYERQDALTRHINNHGHYPDDWIECTCGDHYKRIGMHWSHNPDHRPSFTDHQKEIITGSLMSDGSIYRSDGRNPNLRIQMTTPEYLEYLDEQFGVLSTGVYLQETAEESAQYTRDRGFRPDADASNYHDKYRLCTRRHPELHEFADWYVTGEKVWPCDEIELTPTVLKHLYAGDGCLHQDNNYIIISLLNEIDRIDDVKEMFKRVGFEPQRVNSDETSANLYFSVDTSRDMLDYMGNPPPGFEYKWIDE